MNGVRNIYNNFAEVYDRLMYDVDYKKWADYIETLFQMNHIKPAIILDLGCGTGSFCIEMSKRGYEMIGLDRSVDMLSCAKQKTVKEGMDILYLNQDMAGFELYGTVDAIVCLMDSINYLVNKNDVKKLLKLVKNYLNPGGILIFDINSDYKFKEVFKDNVYYDIGDDVAYIWQNKYDNRRKLCEFILTFFVKENNMYRRYDEIHIERMYPVEELELLIEDSGMKLVNTYGELSFSPPKDKSSKVFFVCMNSQDYCLPSK